MKKEFLILIALALFSLIILIESVMAHCPLCTVGAGAAAAGAVWLGISKVIVALFIGAFAMSMGIWLSKLIKKQYIPFQKSLIIIIIFLTTVLPLLPIFTHVRGVLVDLFGEYGTLLNRTYVVNLSLLNSFLGGFIVLISPLLSRIIKEKVGKGMPFQSILLTFFLLAIASLIIQFAI